MNIWPYRKSTVLATTILTTVGAYGALAHDAAQHDHSTPQIAVDGPEAAYLAENDAAMDKMMADMEVKPSGDVDRDFVAMMTPHHEGAICPSSNDLRRFGLWKNGVSGSGSWLI